MPVFFFTAPHAPGVAATPKALAGPIRVPTGFASVHAPDSTWVAQATADLFAALGPASSTAAMARAPIRLPGPPRPPRTGRITERSGEGGDHGQGARRGRRRGDRGRGKGRGKERGRGKELHS